MSGPRFTGWQALGLAFILLALVGCACLSGLLVGFALGRTTARPAVILPAQDFGPPSPEEPSAVPPGKTYLGVRYIAVTRELARLEGLSVTAGAWLRFIDPGGPAEAAGLREGDIITHVDGLPLDARHDLRDVVGTHAPGDTIELTIVRGDRTLTASVTLAAAPPGD
jgi:hypothetical protein